VRPCGPCSRFSFRCYCSLRRPSPGRNRPDHPIRERQAPREHPSHRKAIRTSTYAVTQRAMELTSHHTIEPLPTVRRRTITARRVTSILIPARLAPRRPPIKTSPRDPAFFYGSVDARLFAANHFPERFPWFANGEGILPALIAAQRLRAASPIAFRPAADKVRLRRTGWGEAIGADTTRGVRPSGFVGPCRTRSLHRVDLALQSAKQLFVRFASSDNSSRCSPFPERQSQAAVGDFAD